MPHLESRNKVDNLIRRYRAHDSKLEGHSLQLAEILREALCLDGRLVDSFQVRANHLAEVGEMREMAFAVKKRAAQLSLQLLNRTRERGLRNVALFSRAREIQFLRDGKKITDLVHLHTDTPRKPPLGPRCYQRRRLTVSRCSPDGPRLGDTQEFRPDARP